MSLYVELAFATGPANATQARVGTRKGVGRALAYTAAQDERDVGGGGVRHGRRLADKVLVAFHQACDIADYEAAESLLRLLELMVTRRPSPSDGSRRRSMESLVAAHERLWYLRNPQSDE